MELKDYIGKKVIRMYDNKEFEISVIKSYRIEVMSVEVSPTGVRSCFVFDTNGPAQNAIARGDFVFVDESLKEPFLKLYEQYVRSSAGCLETDDYYLCFYN